MGKMNLLIINTLSEDNPIVREAAEYMAEKTSACQIIHTEKMKISPCVGCNACWLKTPGICALKDDYEQILKAFLQHDATIILSDTALGFIRYKAKNIIDRMLPVATMYLHFVDGQMRHIPRYDKKFRLGLLYSGDADAQYMNQWLQRVTLNFDGVSIGAFPVEEYRKVSLCT